MKTLLKKVVALTALAALVTINSAYAAGGLSLTGSTTNLTLTGNTATISGSTATGELAVTVSATVLPTLTFDLSSSTLALGDLTIGSYTSTGLTYTGVTNAQGGMSVTLKSLNYLKDGTNVIGDGSQAGTAYKFATGGLIDNGIAFDTTNQALDSRSSNGSIGGNLQIGALIDANTIAGNYTDTLTFTVTGNF